MKEYRFETIVSKDGFIKVPVNKQYYKKKVEVIVKFKERNRKKDMTAHLFIKKWGGILKNVDVDSSRYSYLEKKYK